MNAIEMQAVTFAWPGMPMLFDLTLGQGRLAIVTGPSGAGKSTLLNLIAGFEEPESGHIRLDGKDCTSLAPSERPVSMLFQEHNLFSHLSVADNVGFGITARRRLTPTERDKVGAALARVGLEGKEKRLPHELSGGERQRAAFARTLLADRPVLLLDEPFASLGPGLRQEMMALLFSLQQEKPRTVLAVTHHPLEWREFADSYYFVEAGHIAANGPIGDLSAAEAPDALRAYLGAAALSV